MSAIFSAILLNVPFIIAIVIAWLIARRGRRLWKLPFYIGLFLSLMIFVFTGFLSDKTGQDNDIFLGVLITLLFFIALGVIGQILCSKAVETERRKRKAAERASASAGKQDHDGPFYVESSGRRCPECGAPVPADADFCTKCGARLTDVCPYCGSTVGLDDSFCKKCGKSITH